MGLFRAARRYGNDGIATKVYLGVASDCLKKQKISYVRYHYKNGAVLDGTGAREFAGDIGIKEGIIATVGNLNGEHAERVIDAKGLYVAPGFVDINNHSDTYWQIFLNPDLESLVRQDYDNCWRELRIVSRAARRSIHAAVYSEMDGYSESQPQLAVDERIS